MYVCMFVCMDGVYILVGRLVSVCMYVYLSHTAYIPRYVYSVQESKLKQNENVKYHYSVIRRNESKSLSVIYPSHHLSPSHHHHHQYIYRSISSRPFHKTQENQSNRLPPKRTSSPFLLAPSGEFGGKDCVFAFGFCIFAFVRGSMDGLIDGLIDGFPN